MLSVHLTIYMLSEKDYCNVSYPALHYLTTTSLSLVRVYLSTCLMYHWGDAPPHFQIEKPGGEAPLFLCVLWNVEKAVMFLLHFNSLILILLHIGGHAQHTDVSIKSFVKPCFSGMIANICTHSGPGIALFCSYTEPLITFKKFNSMFNAKPSLFRPQKKTYCGLDFVNWY